MIGVAMNWEFSADVEDKEEWLDQLTRSRLVDQACFAVHGKELKGYLHTRRAVSAARVYAEASMLGGQKMVEKRHVRTVLEAMVAFGSVEAVKPLSKRYQRYVDEAVYKSAGVDQAS